MSLVYLVPLQNAPISFNIVLAGVQYNITTKWNDQQDGGWAIDIEDLNNVPIVCNVPLITGADCLSGLEYLGIGGQLWVLTSGSSVLDVPTFDNLGIDSNLYFQTDSASG